MTISNELYWLSLTLLMSALLWAPYITNRIIEQGLVKAIWDPKGETDTPKLWARRMMQAHQNAVENLVLFAPSVIIIQLLGLNSSTTATACMVYFFARLVHYLVFSFAVPVLRIVSFLTGFAAQMVLLAQILRA